MTTLATGPKYTFMNERGHQSYIDHCIVPEYLITKIQKCEILEDELNMSDHLALSVKMLLPQSLRKFRQHEQKQSVTWHKLPDEQLTRLYTQPLNTAIEPLLNIEATNTIKTTREELDHKKKELIKLMKTMSGALPSSKLPKHLKPYWCSGLTALAKQNKSAWRTWVEAGRPRDAANQDWQELKAAKNAFRREQRRQTATYERKYLEKIEKAHDLDQKLFWRLINKRVKKRPALVRPVSDSNGRVARDTDDIAKVWKDYYEELYTPKDAEVFDSGTKAQIDAEIKKVDMSPNDADTVLLARPITEDEVRKECAALKLGKAPGVDGIQPEHLKYGGSNLYRYLAFLFN